MTRLVTRWSFAAMFLLMVSGSSAAGTLTIDNTNRDVKDIRVLPIGDLPLTTICAHSEAFTCSDDLTIGVLDRGNGATLTFLSGQAALIGGTPQAAAANPEPGTLVLLGSGLLVFAKVVRNRLK